MIDFSYHGGPSCPLRRVGITTLLHLSWLCSWKTLKTQMAQAGDGAGTGFLLHSDQRLKVRARLQPQAGCCGILSVSLGPAHSLLLL